MDVIIHANGNISKSMIQGEIRANCHLSGMPDLTLTFTKPHQLVNCSHFPFPISPLPTGIRFLLLGVRRKM